MNKDLKNTDNLVTLEHPVIGEACLFRHRSQSKVWRARVQSDTQLILVDTGEVYNKDEGEMFEIEEKFLKLPELSVKVSLANIEAKGRNWTPHVCNLIKEKLVNQLEEIVIDVTECHWDKVEVMMYQINMKDDLCINHWLVLEGVARLSKETNLLSCDQSVMIRRSKLKSLERRSYACRVVSATSPGSIFLRNLVDERDFKEMEERMQEVYNNSNTNQNSSQHFKSNDLAVVYNHETKLWERCRILKCVGIKVDLYLMDSGKQTKSKQQFLKPLKREFRFKNYYTEQVYLADILPNSNSGNWNKKCKEYLESLLSEAGMMVEVEMEEAGGDVTPVKIFANVVRGNRCQKIDVQQELVTRGLACFKVLRSSHQVVDQLTAGENDNYDDMLVEAEPAFMWRPGHPDGQELEAVACYVDWCGVVYLRQPRPSLDLVNRALQRRYEGSVAGEEDGFWSVGDACIVEWSVDQGWYRAVVLRVFPNVCRVQLCDYGTEAHCYFRNMRKQLMMQDLPVQSFPLKVSNISSATWTEEEITILHEMIVDKTVAVILDNTSEVSEYIFDIVLI